MSELSSDLSQGKLALVVDDSPVQRRVLSVLLGEEGYRVITAEDGAHGVDMYIKHSPDLVLMDINMPIMNGYEAAKRIKSLSLNALCPMVFITSMNSDQSFIEAIEAGGDGILVRPFSPAVFKAKIKSIQRISDIYGELKRLQIEQQMDAELAEQLMSGVIESRNYALDRIGILKQPAALFSGDIQLSSLCPNGDVNVMLGDFTGHGLRSSIGAIPLAETFRAMTKKGFSLIEIITQINKQLADLLPPDLFLAAAFVTVSSNDSTVYVFNAGLPECYIFNAKGEIKEKILSSHPPLGVVSKLLPNTNLQICNVSSSDHVVLISDGIVEAHNDKGEMYDFERFEQAASLGVIKQDVCKYVQESVNDFCVDMPQEDDISLISIPCGGWTQEVIVSALSHESSDIMPEESSLSEPAWTWGISLSGARLGKVNPIPMAMNQIHDIEDHADHWQNLYTILTELFINAIDHGVLGLSSDLKQSAEGFAQYFKEREERLHNLNSGFIDISMEYYPTIHGGRLSLIIKDSGKGFDYKNYLLKKGNQQTEQELLSGRGILLVRKLTQSLRFSENGTKVEAAYVWSNAN